MTIFSVLWLFGFIVLEFDFIFLKIITGNYIVFGGVNQNLCWCKWDEFQAQRFPITGEKDVEVFGALLLTTWFVVSLPLWADSDRLHCQTEARDQASQRARACSAGLLKRKASWWWRGHCLLFPYIFLSGTRRQETLTEMQATWNTCSFLHCKFVLFGIWWNILRTLFFCLLYNWWELWQEVCSPCEYFWAKIRQNVSIPTGSSLNTTEKHCLEGFGGRKRDQMQLNYNNMLIKIPLASEMGI